jgi:dephospho-CoA kinase
MTGPALSIGLTGGIGSGKTTVANMFAELGAALVDTDLIAHELTQANGVAIGAIKAEFGAGFILASGAMDRVKMRDYVFSYPDQKKRLENILHPLIQAETEAAAKRSHGLYTIFVVPLLVESRKWKQRVGRVLVIDCCEELQIDRVMSRNGLTLEQIAAIMQTQATREQRLQAADDVITNEGELAEVRQQVKKLHEKYLKLIESIRTKST